MKVLSVEYVKAAREGKTLAESLALKIVDAYPDQIKKDMIIYGDASANSKSAGSNTTFFAQVFAELRAAGWKVIARVLKTNPEHKDRFALIDRILAEGSTNLPRLRINQNTCKALIISMQNSPIGSNMKKDKSSEGTSLQQEYATHLSDCLDYILYYKYSSSKPKSSGSGEIRWLSGR